MARVRPHSNLEVSVAETTTVDAEPHSIACETAIVPLNVSGMVLTTGLRQRTSEMINIVLCRL